MNPDLKFKDKSLLIASNNIGKVKEIRSLLANFNIEILAATDFNIIEPEENGSDFAENALIKAKYYSQHSSLPALADDSGLCIDALNGEPGVHSARWAGPNKDFLAAIAKIETLIADKPNLDAHFICALSLYWPDGKMVNVSGKIAGKLTFPPRGNHGFGYDPIFIPNGSNLTFAEMNHEEKEKISHRTRAFNNLIAIVL